MELQQYWQEVKQRVCRRCIDSDGYGNCLIDPSIDCTLQLYFPKVVEVVSKVHSEKMDDYIRDVRSTICVACKYQTATGLCLLRATVECPLDRYLPLVIEAIERVETVT